MGERDLQARLEELSVVAEVGRAMLSPLGLQQVLKVGLEQVSRSLGAKFGSITLLSPDKRTLDIVAVHNLPKDYGERVRRASPIRADRSSPSGRVALTKRPLPIADVLSDPIFAPWRELAEQEGFQAFIGVPLMVGAEAIGTLNLYFPGRHDFSPHEIHLVEATCGQVCLAIERAHLYEELKAASQRKSEFLVAMSHELRAPMTAILGFADVLRNQISGPLNERQQRQLRMISSSAQHLMLLINDALDLAKIEAGKMDTPLEPVDAQALVEDALEMMEPLAEAKGLTVEWRAPSPAVMLQCDRQKSMQILVNLVSNAIKFTSRGGLKIQVHTGSGAPPAVRISVTDSGIGLKPEDIPRLFQEFLQLPDAEVPTVAGTGLGLSISRKLARLMGGDIEVRSTYGQGSTFTLRLAAAL